MESESRPLIPPTMSSGSAGVHVAEPERLPAGIIHEISADAEDSEKTQQMLEASPSLTAEADEAERVVELLDVTPPVLGAEADDEEKAASLLAPLGLTPHEDEV